MDLRRSDNHRVFYPLRRGVLVTDGWFCDQTQRLALREIGSIGWCQASVTLHGRAARLVIGTELVLVIAVGSVATAIAGSSAVAIALAVLQALFVTGVTLVATHRAPRPLQLWAEYRGGTQVMLFSSADQTEFHKVRRAMERAVEYNHELAA